MTRGRFFVHFFRGKFRWKFSHKNLDKKIEFSAEKVLKNRFSKKICGIFRGKKCTKNRLQIGRIFAQWAILNFWQLFRKLLEWPSFLGFFFYGES
jgi:hypothetical protein